MNVLAPVLRWEKVRLTSAKNSRATLAEPFLQLRVTARLPPLDCELLESTTCHNYLAALCVTWG